MTWGCQSAVCSMPRSPPCAANQSQSAVPPWTLRSITAEEPNAVARWGRTCSITESPVTTTRSCSPSARTSGVGGEPTVVVATARVVVVVGARVVVATARVVVVVGARVVVATARVVVVVGARVVVATARVVVVVVDGPLVVVAAAVWPPPPHPEVARTNAVRNPDQGQCSRSLTEALPSRRWSTSLACAGNRQPVRRKKCTEPPAVQGSTWSGRRDSNPRPSPWQGMPTCANTPKPSLTCSSG